MKAASNLLDKETLEIMNEINCANGYYEYVEYFRAYEKNPAEFNPSWPAVEETEDLKIYFAGLRKSIPIRAEFFQSCSAFADDYKLMLESDDNIEAIDKIIDEVMRLGF